MLIKYFFSFSRWYLSWQHSTDLPVITVHSTRHWQSAGCPRLPESWVWAVFTLHTQHSHSQQSSSPLLMVRDEWSSGRQVGDMNLISLRGSLGCGSTDSLVIWMMRPTVIAVMVKTKETGNSLTNIWAECCTIYWTDKNLYLQCLRLSRIVAVAQKIFHGWKMSAWWWN